MKWLISAEAGSKIEDELLCARVAVAALVAVRVLVAEPRPSVAVPGANAPTMFGEAVAAGELRGVESRPARRLEPRPRVPPAVDDALVPAPARDRADPPRRRVLVARPTLLAGARVSETADGAGVLAAAAAAGAGAGAAAAGEAAAAVAVGPDAVAPWAFPLPLPWLAGAGAEALVGAAEVWVGAAEVWVGAAEVWVVACGLPLPWPRPSASPLPLPFTLAGA